MSTTPLAVWLAFGGLIAVLLAIDLFVIGRGERGMSLATATRWSATVVAVALLFGLHLWFNEGLTKAGEYYAGYLIELSLSVDNLFVFLMIFDYFAVPAAAQPRVLHWGILTAIVLRGVMIFAGVLLLDRFDWIIFVFGAILVITAVKMLTQSEARIEPEKNPLVRLARRVLPVTPAFQGSRFLVRSHRGWYVTPLLLVLIVVEWSDLVFAIDSIPAVFAVTRDPFIVFSSNVFAILGLRAMFFVLADAMHRFRYLKPGVAIILAFVGVKMLASYWIHLSTGISLATIVAVLGTAIVASLVRARREAARIHQ
ncbi:MAG: TerC family protein [Gemmatimonadales bacterium]